MFLKRDDKKEKKGKKQEEINQRGFRLLNIYASQKTSAPSSPQAETAK